MSCFWFSVLSTDRSIFTNTSETDRPKIKWSSDVETRSSWNENNKSRKAVCEDFPDHFTRSIRTFLPLTIYLCSPEVQLRPHPLSLLLYLDHLTIQLRIPVGAKSNCMFVCLSQPAAHPNSLPILTWWCRLLTGGRVLITMPQVMR